MINYNPVSVTQPNLCWTHQPN